MKLKDFLIISFIASGIIGVAISYHKIYLFHLLLALILFFFILNLFKNNFKIRYIPLPTNFHHFFYFMFLWYLLSILWSLHISYSITYMVYIASGIFLSLTIIYYVNTNEKKQQRVFSVASYLFLILIIICILEIFTDFSLPHSPHDLPSKIPTGFWGNQNNLAIIMSIVFPFFVFYHNVIVKYMGCLIILFIVFSASSRANILAIIFMILIYIFAYRKTIQLSVILKACITIFILLFAFNFYNHISNEKFIEIQAIKSSYTALQRYFYPGENKIYDSIAIRQQLIINGLEALKESNGFGIGGGVSKYVQEKNANSPITSMHNFWVELLVEGGVIFFLVFSLWYLYLIKTLYLISWKSKNKVYNYLASATSLSLIGFIPAAVSASSTIYLLPMWILYGFAITVINIYKTCYEKSIVFK